MENIITNQTNEPHGHLDLQLSLRPPVRDHSPQPSAVAIAAAGWANAITPSAIPIAGDHSPQPSAVDIAATCQANAITPSAITIAGNHSPQPSAVAIAAACRANAITNMRITRNLGTRRSSLRRCNSRSPRTTETIEPPYPWSTNRRAVVQTLNDLKSNQILTITGDVRCRQCQREYAIEYNTVSKFEEIASFVEENKNLFRDRAPRSWMNPNYPTCRFCGHENGARPVIPGEWRKINWLFLLLGEMLGALNLNHLKYFCSYTNNHRTGAKNRLLYLTYITLCHQVDPSGRFRRG